MILANNENMDVYNCLNIMDNTKVFDDLVFKPGSGYLHYYLYNYRLESKIKPADLGIILVWWYKYV